MTERAHYDSRFFAKIAAIEEKHFWFQARNRAITCIVKQIVMSFQPGYRFIEMGCGTGVVLRELVRVCRAGSVIGTDVFPEAVAFARKKALCPVFLDNIERPTLVERADAIGLFDVLEHLPDDGKILSRLNQMLKPGGVLILTVPAHMCLWSYFDVAAHHCRRYAPAALAELLGHSGFQVEYLTQLMASLFPLLWLTRRMAGKAGVNHERAAERAEAELRIVPVLNGLLKFVLTAEAFAIQRHWRLPLGTSLLAVARKKRS